MNFFFHLTLRTSRAQSTAESRAQSAQPSATAAATPATTTAARTGLPSAEELKALASRINEETFGKNIAFFHFYLRILFFDFCFIYRP